MTKFLQPKTIKNISLFLLFFLFYLVFSSLPTLSADKVKRVISLVYDDSGSMYENNSLKWVHTNYAMQAFIGLLNNDDELYMTYLSDFSSNIPLSSRKRNVSDNDKQNTINLIRETPGRLYRSTDFQAVVKAAEILDGLPNQPGTEYWLVVLTDGQFGGSRQDLTNNLKVLQSRVELKGKNCKVMYIAIGKDAVEVSEEPGSGLYARKVDTHNITTVLAQTAGIIAGKTAIDMSQMQCRGNELTIDNQLPVRAMVILNQKQKNSIETIKNPANPDQQFIIQNTYSMTYPEAFSVFPTDTSLNGQIFYVSNKNKRKSIPPGKVNFTFEQPLEFAGTTVLFEPAIVLKMTLYQNNQPVQIDQIKAGERIQARLTLHDIDTGQEIAPDIIPGKPQYQIIFRQGKHIEETKGQTESNPYITEQGPLKITASAALANCFNLRAELEGNIIRIRTITMEVETPQPWKASLSNLKKTPVATVNIRLDGRRPTVAEFRDLRMTVNTDRKINFMITKQPASQSFAIQPDYHWGKFFTATGKIPLTITVETGRPGETVQGQLEIQVQDIPWWEKYGPVVIAVLILLILIWYIRGIIIKPRFAKKNALIEYKKTQFLQGVKLEERVKTELFYTNTFKRWFVPYIPERCNIRGILFIAGKKKHYVILPPEAQTEKMRIDGIALGEEAGQRPIQITDNTVIEVTKNNISHSYRFLYT